MQTKSPVCRPPLDVRELAVGGAPAQDGGTAACVSRSVSLASIRPRCTRRLQVVGAARAKVVSTIVHSIATFVYVPRTGCAHANESLIEFNTMTTRATWAKRDNPDAMRAPPVFDTLCQMAQNTNSVCCFVLLNQHWDIPKVDSFPVMN